MPTLAEALRKDGVATGAFVSSAALDPAFGLARGFDVYDDRFVDAQSRPSSLDSAKASATGPLAKSIAAAGDGHHSPGFICSAHAPCDPPSRSPGAS